MSKQFAMSMYMSSADLYKAKAEHYQKCYELLAQRMVETEDLRYDKEICGYYCPHSGDYIEDLV